MEDGELEFSNSQEMLLSDLNISELPDSSFMDSFLNEILKDTHACTHAHTCNPPGPDNSHTHTCYHVHTKIVPPTPVASSEDNTAESVDDKKEGKKRPLGNREAVRKYREKKKARAALLEDEVVRLRAVNQQLLKRLQGQVVLEAELVRLKCLLVDMRGRIEGEIGCFPYAYNKQQQQMNPCNVQCNVNDYSLHCLQPGGSDGGISSEVNDQGLNSNCGFDSLHCLAGGNQQISGVKEPVRLGVGYSNKPVSVSGGSKRSNKNTN
ncbi:unnamed protein product [Cuscuta europaea]|uniref:BZIP domain-containing protein n=1 Tax=Cuscuta europaea TaxID=41803 RepID=A0A9P1DXF5_CUSEU|nr:unnamed protein product [Cuscuta europaea]